MSDYIYIDSPHDFNPLLEALEASDRIAIDTEADSFHHYFEKVCLIQITWDGQHAVVDPLSSVDIPALIDLFSRKTLLLHGADYDLRMLRQGYGFRPNEMVLDTVIGAQILGIARFGLQNLIEQYTGVQVPKDSQQSDWSARPLSEKQLRYAVNDTRYLHQIVATMEDELRAAGRLEWWHESCLAQIDATAEEREKDPDRVWRIKGYHKCSPRELAFLKALWYWRDEQAREIDRPAFMIASNSFLLKIAFCAADLPDHCDLPQLDYPRNFQGKRLNELKKAISRTQALPPDQYPDILKAEGSRLPKDIADRIDSFRRHIRKLADDLGIDAPFICSKASATSIICEDARTVEEIRLHGKLTNWQATLLEPILRNGLTD